MEQKIRTPYGKTTIYSAETSAQGERIMVVPGYSESITHNRRLVDALAEQGGRSFTFSQPRRNGSGDPLLRQGHVVVDVIESVIPRNEKIHAAAHSLGAAAALKAAQEAPERFASLILMQPAGVAGEQGLPELLQHVTKKITKNQIGATRRQGESHPTNATYATVDTESARHYFYRVLQGQLAGGGILIQNPALALKEALAAGVYDLTEDIKTTSEIGIPIHIVKAHSDEMFETGTVDQTLEHITELIGSYSSIADRTARHDTFWLQPKRTAHIVMALAKQATRTTLQNQ